MGHARSNKSSPRSPPGQPRKNCTVPTETKSISTAKSTGVKSKVRIYELNARQRRAD
jgi:hypothetical protein